MSDAGETVQARSNPNGTIGYLIALTLIALSGFIGVMVSTYTGAGWVNDSFQYIGAARNLLHGNGLTIPFGANINRPLTHYPPVFSLVLAAVELLGGNAIRDVRLLNAALYVVNVFLVGFTLKYITRSYIFSLAGALLAAVSPVFITIHSWALSEPLYLSLNMACFLSLAPYFKNNDRRWLYFSSILAGLAVMTRYVAVALGGSVALLILLIPGKPWKHKIRDAVVYLAISILPFIIWTGYTLLVTQSFDDRSLGPYAITGKNWLALSDTFLEWIMPQAISQNHVKEIITLALLAGLLSTVLYQWRRRVREGRSSDVNGSICLDPLILLYAIYAGLYILTIFSAKLLLDQAIGMSSRIFSPVLLSFWVLLVALAAALWNKAGGVGRVLVVTFYIYLIFYYVSATIPMVRRYNKQGVSAPGRIMNDSRLLETVQQLHTQGTVYTNWIFWYYLWTGQPADDVIELLNNPPTNNSSTSNTNVNPRGKQVIYLVIFDKAPVPPGIKQATKTLTIYREPWISDNAVSIYRYIP